MPNWCYNYATFTHENSQTVDDFEKVLRAYARDEEKALGPFQYLYPMPDNSQIEPTHIVAVTDEGEEKIIKSSMPDWWHWRVGNWGTKWEPSDLLVTRKDAHTLEIVFYSAWSPPIGLYDHAQGLGWTVLANYRENGFAFEGDYEDGANHCRNIEESEECEE